MKRVVLLNPNTSQALTAVMQAIASDCAPPGLRIEGLTAPSGPALITCDAEHEEAARVVRSLAPELARGADAVIVSAFGDPGADALSNELACPVVGIAEAAMRAAASGGRCFAVITHVPRLRRRMAARAVEIGLEALCAGVLATEGDPVALMSDPARLECALQALAERAVTELGAEAIVVGGGPLGPVARALSGRISVPVIEAIPEAVRRIAALFAERATR